MTLNDRKKQLAEWLIRTGHKFLPKTETTPDTFVSLAPTSSVPEKEGKIYFDALTWALQRNDLKNIALTGPYGSGKSSILQTFQENNRHYRFLNISLATFGADWSGANPAGKDNGGKSQNLTKGETTSPDKVEKAAESIDHNLIELSILQQIFYSEEQSSIPDSRFSRITGMSKKRLSFYVFLFLLWIASITYLMDIGFSKKSIFITNLVANYKQLLTAVNYTIFVSGAFYLANTIARALRRISFKKLKLATGKLELEGETGGNVLNRHFEELLYFFQATEYDGLIIEDLDRFKDAEIFSKLRELNLLINNSMLIRKKHKKPVVFIYGIKDDLFLVGDRTKFFDFILPVIPVANSSNAGDYLYKLLKDNKMSGSLDLPFIYTIGLYIDDMRLIKNIFNEFKVYRSKVTTNADKKLISIIAYKNIYPKDFSDLHSRRGMIYELFENKNNVVTSLAVDYDKKIEEIQQKITQLEREIAMNGTELRIIYINTLRKMMPDFNRLYTGNQTVMLTDLESEQGFNRLRTVGQINYYDKTENTGPHQHISA